MPRDIVVTAGEEANRWSRQFCRQPAWTASLAAQAGMSVPQGSRDMVVPRGFTRSDLVAAVTAAARLARGGRVIYNLGHGYGGQAGANVMFSPTPSFTVTSDIVAGNRTVAMGSATVRVTLGSDEADVRTHFMQIGAALAANGVRQFVFLVCGVGANTAFMQQIKAAWGGRVSVAGWADGVTLETDVTAGDSTYPRTRLYLYRDGGNPRDASNRARFGTGTSAVPASWLEMPAGMVAV